MFKIVEVPEDAADVFEQLGTKRKFWYWNTEDQQVLFKEGRPLTGENWAEKVACELCAMLDLPHADYELACWKGNEGVVSPTFVPIGGRLVLGNELLPHIVHGYEREKRYKQKQHTIKRVIIILKTPEIQAPLDFTPCQDIDSALDVFIGYLMLDALIANQDRHHENWGVILTPDKRICLAPTFDHASGFGRNETDETRVDRLTTRDRRRSVEAYVERAITPFYLTPTSKVSLSTVDAFKEAAKFSPSAKSKWLNRLKTINQEDTLSIFKKIPINLISQPAVDFAQRILLINKERLLSLG